MSHLALVEAGIASSIAIGADATLSSLRAGISGVTRHPSLSLEAPDPEWDPREALRAGGVASIAPSLRGSDRLIALALAAFRDLVERAAIRRADLAEMPLLFALPEIDAAVARWELDTLPSRFLARAGIDPTSPIAIETRGATSAFALLASAPETATRARASSVILVAADSFLDADRVRVWDDARRLRSKRTPDGFLPGEAAVALLLSVDPSRAGKAILHAPAIAREPHPIEGERVSSGAGLTTAVRAAIESSPSPLTAVIGDLNGESYRAFEWSLVVTRLAAQLASARLTHPADCLGDIGAAFAPLAIAHVAHLAARGRRNDPATLIFSGASSGERGALVASSRTDLS